MRYYSQDQTLGQSILLSPAGGFLLLLLTAKVAKTAKPVASKSARFVALPDRALAELGAISSSNSPRAKLAPSVKAMSQLASLLLQWLGTTWLHTRPGFGELTG